MTKSKQLKRLKRLTLPNNNISDEGAIAIANCDNFKRLTELDFYGNVISDDGVKAIAESSNMANLKKLNLYGNLIEDEGAIALAESKTLTRLRYLFLTSNRCAKQESKRLKKQKAVPGYAIFTRMILKNFVYQDDYEEDEDQISSWDELEAKGQGERKR